MVGGVLAMLCPISELLTVLFLICLKVLSFQIYKSVQIDKFNFLSPHSHFVRFSFFLSCFLTGIRSAEQTKRTVQQANERKGNANHSRREAGERQISRSGQPELLAIRGDHEQRHLAKYI